MLTRRQFLDACGALGATALLGCDRGGPDPGGPGAPGPPAPEGDLPFPASMLRSSRQELDGPLTVVGGALPDDLLGHVFIVGPVARGGTLFCGDGMVIRLSLAGGAPRLRSRFVRTDDFLVDQAATDPELAFHDRGLLRTSPAFGMRNLANTAPIVVMGGRLLCAYDAGRPWEVDPDTLAPLTAVGRLDAYRPMLPPLVPGLGFFPPQLVTAHPAFDRDEGVLYLCNYAAQTEGTELAAFTRILRWDGRAEPTATELVAPDGKPLGLRQTCHQIQVTRDHVVLQDGAFALEPEQLSGEAVTRAQMPVSVFYVVRKADLRPGAKALAHRVELPVESVHFFAARDDAGGRLTLVVPHTGAVDPSEWLRESDVDLRGRPIARAAIGYPVGGADLSLLGRHVIALGPEGARVVDSRTLRDARLWGLALFTQDERGAAGIGQRYYCTFGFRPEGVPRRIAEVYRDHPYRQVPLAELPARPLPCRLLRVDEGALAIADEYEVPAGWAALSPTFVPRRGGGPDEGYLVVLAAGPDACEVWVLDAGALSRGPLCRLRHPDLQPGFTLHTAWVEELARPATGRYRVEPRDDYGERIKVLSPAAQALARRVLDL